MTPRDHAADAGGDADTLTRKTGLREEAWQAVVDAGATPTLTGPPGAYPGIPYHSFGCSSGTGAAGSAHPGRRDNLTGMSRTCAG